MQAATHKSEALGWLRCLTSQPTTCMDNGLLPLPAPTEADAAWFNVAILVTHSHLVVAREDFTTLAFRLVVGCWMG